MPDQTTKPEARNGGLAAAAHYFGEVMRARLKPSGHRFNHRVMSVLIDGHSLGSLAALAQRRAPDAPSECRTCESCLQ
jgi:hypothetical protein